MGKKEFLNSIIKKMSDFPKTEVDKAIEYYSEIIDDKKESGMTEQAAIESLGPIDEIIEELYLNSPMKTLIKKRLFPDKSLSIWKNILIIFGSIISLPIIFTVALTIYLIFAVLILMIYIINFSFIVTSIGVLISSIRMAFLSYYTQAIILFGMLLILIGVTILLLIFTFKISKKVSKFNSKYFRWLKSVFFIKEMQHE
ncbi:MAG: DUF1700 domain-containing protein [Tissierellia bacterium]|nr:DUF1700 domain-containing protein [Tissierellia bacterium]